MSADTNEPLAGVNIRVDNSLTGCTTNGKGEFIIDNLPDGQHTLRFSYIDTSAAIGCMIELVEQHESQSEFFRRVAEAADGWDGVTDPLRPGFPA